jgi:hypothetical protein
MERWWQRWYARAVIWLARRSWRSCTVHGKDIVVCGEGPYPMCPLCMETVFREWSDETADRAIQIIKDGLYGQDGAA